MSGITIKKTIWCQIKYTIKMIKELSCSKNNGTIQTCIRLRKDFFDVLTQPRSRKASLKKYYKNIVLDYPF